MTTQNSLVKFAQTRISHDNLGQLSFVYSKHHPLAPSLPQAPPLQWLPTKLAEWIANNLQDELGFPNKADPRRGWNLPS